MLEGLSDSFITKFTHGALIAKLTRGGKARRGRIFIVPGRVVGQLK